MTDPATQASPVADPSAPAASRHVVVIGDGRAGGSLAGALRTAGWQVTGPLGRHDDHRSAVVQADVVVVATPDAAVAPVAASLVGTTEAVVVHLAGSLGLDVLRGHARCGSLHPLVSLPSPEVGQRRLVGAWFAVAGDPVTIEMVESLSGRHVVVDDADRAAYHAAACIASNHLVALLAQAERVAATAGVPLEPLLGLVRGTVDNVAELGCATALTGPAARGDADTIEAHRRALPPGELPAYDAMVAEARRLAASRDAGGPA